MIAAYRKNPAWLILAVVLVALSVVAVVRGVTTISSPEGPAVSLGDIEVRPSGEDVPASSAIFVAFKRPVNQQAVQSGFRLEPETPGALSWKGNTLVYRPQWPGLARGITYRVRVPVPETMRATVDGEELTFSFTTAGKLAVQSVIPASEGTEVAPESAVMVQFNRPVAPLTTLRDAPQEDVLQFDPPVAGSGRWLTSTLYTFRPAPSFQPATSYKVAVPPTLSDTLGGTLGEAYTWTFRTISPGVADTFPRDNTRFVGPNTEVKVIFNQAVDQPGAQAAFSLAGSNGTPVAGAFFWEDARTLVFRPAAPLERDQSYAAKVAAGGPANIAKEMQWAFRTVPPAQVTDTSPRDGDPRASGGSVTIGFATPMDRESVEAALQIEPKPEQQLHPGWGESDLRMFLYFPQQPSRPYTVRIGPGAKDRYGQPLPPVSISYTTAPRQPSANFVRPGFVGSFSAYTTPRVLLRAVNLAQVRVGLHRLTRAQFLDRLANPDQRQGPPAGATPIRQWEQDTDPAPENVLSLTSLELPGGDAGALAPGYYLLTLTGGLAPDSLLFTVSKTHLTVKQTETQTLVWATDLDSGLPVADVPLTLYQVQPSREEVARATTNAQGIAVVETPRPRQPEKGFSPNVTAVIAERDGDVAYGSSQLNRGIAPWNFQISYQGGSQPWNGFVYTDRPIYRPGQTVYYKGVLRQDDDARYSLPPAGSSFIMEVRDPMGRLVSSREVALSDYGAFDGSLDLAGETALGSHNLTVRLPGENPQLVASGQFTVAAYRRPEYEVTVQPAQREVINGEAIPVTASAAYYFGAPVTDAPLRWRSTSRDYFFQVPDAPGYSFSDLDPGQPRPQGQQRPSGEGTTDHAGSAAFSVPASIDRDPVSQVYTIETTVTDTNHQTVSDRAEVIVHRGAFYIGLKPDRYVGRAGEEATVHVLTVDTKTQPAGNLPLTAEVVRRTWISVKQQDASGEVRWVSQPQDTPVTTVSVTTDQEGKAVVRFTPNQGGVYRVVATGRDRLGNTVRSAAMVWVASREYIPWAVNTEDRMELVADRKEYQVGDTARVLVPAPFAGGTALITLERGKILSHDVRTLESNSTVLDIPITADHIPNIYLSVALFKGGTAEGPAAFKLGYVELPVATTAKRLDVGLTADKTKLGPGETVTYTVTTRDSSGKPIAAEVSLAVVDAAVLALTGDALPDPLSQFYRRRWLGVLTGDSLAVSLDRLAELAGGADREGGGKGGGGADADRARSQFKDTAYWNATVRTDAQGRVQVSVPLPDNLTTWRLIAVAATPDTLVGAATTDIVTSKPLLVRPATPRFLVVGDQALMEAVVHNYTDQAAQAEVSLEATGVMLPEGAPQRVSIPAGGSQKVGWPVTVDRNAEVVSLTFTARAGSFSDGVALALPVSVYATPETTGNAGTVQDAVQELVEIPGYVDPERGGLTVTVEPSLAAGMAAGLDYLKEYPYECTEATVSRFLPRLAAARAITKLGLPDPSGLRDELPALLARSLQRLYTYQNQDGGWGWCRYDQSETTITAYALLGLSQAKQDGYAIDENVLMRAVGFLRSVLDRPSDVQNPAKPDSRAFILYVLAAAGQGDLGRGNLLADQRTTLGNQGKALLALALATQTKDPKYPGAQSLVSDLTSAAIVSNTGAHWEDPRNDPRNMNTNTRTTALVLEALVRVDPEHPLVDNAVRWLMTARKDGRWQSTYETAWSLLALTDFMEVRGETRGNYAYLVALNGEQLATGRVEGATGLEPQSLMVAVQDLLLDEENRVAISRNGSGGPLYYTMHLNYYPDAQEVESASNGLSIAREYSLQSDTAGRLVQEARAGDVIEAKITLVAPHDLHFVTVEDPFPAGLEPIDASLKTSSQEFQERLNQERGKQQMEEATQAQPEPRPYWHYWGQAEMRDDRLTLMARFLPQGVHEYTYFLQVTRPGVYRVLPVRAFEQYFPEVWGRSDGSVFTVRP